jgi:hypothetical protein
MYRHQMNATPVLFERQRNAPASRHSGLPLQHPCSLLGHATPHPNCFAILNLGAAVVGSEHLLLFASRLPRWTGDAAVKNLRP